MFWLGLQIIFTASDAHAAIAQCLKHAPIGYEFIKNEKEIDLFQNKEKKLLLSVKCEPATMTIATLHASLAVNFDLIQIKNLAFYFDKDASGVRSRSYFIPGSPVKQLSFITNDDNSKWLGETEQTVDSIVKD